MLKGTDAPARGTPPAGRSGLQLVGRRRGAIASRRPFSPFRPAAALQPQPQALSTLRSPTWSACRSPSACLVWSPVTNRGCSGRIDPDPVLLVEVGVSAKPAARDKAEGRRPRWPPAVSSRGLRPGMLGGRGPAGQQVERQPHQAALVGVCQQLVQFTQRHPSHLGDLHVLVRQSRPPLYEQEWWTVLCTRLSWRRTSSRSCRAGGSTCCDPRSPRRPHVPRSARPSHRSRCGPLGGDQSSRPLRSSLPMTAALP